MFPLLFPLNWNTKTSRVSKSLKACKKWIRKKRKYLYTESSSSKSLQDIPTGILETKLEDVFSRSIFFTEESSQMMMEESLANGICVMIKYFRKRYPSEREPSSPSSYFLFLWYALLRKRVRSWLALHYLFSIWSPAAEETGLKKESLRFFLLHHVFGSVIVSFVIVFFFDHFSAWVSRCSSNILPSKNFRATFQYEKKNLQRQSKIEDVIKFSKEDEKKNMNRWKFVLRMSWGNEIFFSAVFFTRFFTGFFYSMFPWNWKMSQCFCGCCCCTKNISREGILHHVRGSPSSMIVFSHHVLWTLFMILFLLFTWSYRTRVCLLLWPVNWMQWEQVCNISCRDTFFVKLRCSLLLSFDTFTRKTVQVTRKACNLCNTNVWTELHLSCCSRYPFIDIGVASTQVKSSFLDHTAKSLMGERNQITSQGMQLKLIAQNCSSFTAFTNQMPSLHAWLSRRVFCLSIFSLECLRVFTDLETSILSMHGWQFRCIGTSFSDPRRPYQEGILFLLTWETTDPCQVSSFRDFFDVDVKDGNSVQDVDDSRSEMNDLCNKILMIACDSCKMCVFCFCSRAVEMTQRETFVVSGKPHLSLTNVLLKWVNSMAHFQFWNCSRDLNGWR